MANSERKLSVYRFIGLIGVLGIIVWSILVGGSPLMFVHIPCLVIVIGITFFALLATFQGDFLRFIPDALLNIVSSNNTPNPKFAQIALFASRYIVGASIIGMLIGVIQMLSNLSDPSDIGPGLAVALLTPFYAVIISEIFCAILYKSYSSGDIPHGKPLPTNNAVLPAAATGLALIIFLILIISFASFDF